MSTHYRYLFNSIFLVTTLAGSAAIAAPHLPSANVPQEEHRRQEGERYYDRSHNDYHRWDDREDRSYRVYLTERHREYHPFAESPERDRRAYWTWRHHHPDHDGR